MVTHQLRQPLRSVLCPVDFSAPSRRALGQAVAIARSAGSRLTVMYVDDPLLNASAAAAGYNRKRLKSDAVKEMRRLLGRIGGLSQPLRVQFEYAVGKPPAEIVKAARRLKPDLIVMGTHGRRGLSRLLFGSTTEQVLRRAPVTVLAVPPHARRSRLILPASLAA